MTLVATRVQIAVVASRPWPSNTWMLPISGAGFVRGEADTKKLGRIAGIGHRITGRTRGAVNRHHGIGWEALHVCIDDATRLAYSEILANERKDSAIGFLERALNWFAGSAYLSKAFRAALAAAGLKHKRTRVHARTNGKAERFVQTSLREWAYARPYATSQGGPGRRVGRSVL